MNSRNNSSGCLSIMIELLFLPLTLGFKITFWIIKWGVILSITLIVCVIYFLVSLVWLILKTIVGLVFGIDMGEFRGTTGEEFEDYCCKQLRNKGYYGIKKTARTGDHGVDIIAIADGKKYAIQCKYYTGTVGNHAIQEAFSGCCFYDCDFPVVLTNSTFTKQAVEDGAKLNVLLWENINIPSHKGFLSGFFNTITKKDVSCLKNDDFQKEENLELNKKNTKKMSADDLEVFMRECNETLNKEDKNSDSEI